jgi:hypothetical protein
VSRQQQRRRRPQQAERVCARLEAAARKWRLVSGSGEQAVKGGGAHAGAGLGGDTLPVTAVKEVAGGQVQGQGSLEMEVAWGHAVLWAIRWQ